MWSFGVLAYQLFMNVTPYRYNDDLEDLLNEIYDGYAYFGEHIPR